MGQKNAGFDAFASARWASMVRAAVVLGSDLHDAQDVAQTALVRCYMNWKKIEQADNMDAYVYKIVLNCHRDQFRRTSARHILVQEPAGATHGPDRPGFPDSTETSLILREALRGLSRPQREVVVLRYLAGLSEEETARTLWIPRGTVKSRLSRSLAALAQSRNLQDVMGGDRHE